MWGGLPSTVAIGSGVAGAAVIAAHGVFIATHVEVIRVDFLQKTGWEFAKGFSLLEKEEGVRRRRRRTRALRGIC